jgi:predicted ferric reductase
MAAGVSTATTRVRPLAVLGAALRWLAIASGLGGAGVLTGRALQSVAGARMAPWIIGRAAGVAAYLLLVTLVLLGLALSHPWRARVARPSAATRIRAHIALAIFTVGFTALHIVVLATDRYAGVGWHGALVPMGASYRPAATTLGLIGLWLAVITGVSAALAGRLPHRLWWPVHKVAALSLVLVWLHGIRAGGDTPVLLAMYLTTGAAVIVVAVSRYVAKTPADVRHDAGVR